MLEQTGRLLVLRVPPPNDVDRDGAWIDEVEMWMLRHAPGRNAREMRLALGQMDDERPTG